MKLGQSQTAFFEKSTISLVLGIFCLAWAPSSFGASDYTAKIYEAGSNRKKELFVLDVKFQAMGTDEKATATYSDFNKEVAFVDTAILRGDKIVRSEIEQKQIGAKATVEIRDGRAYFTKTENGKTKTDDEAIKGDFVMSGNFQRFVKSKWPDLIAGKPAEFRYGVWDRLETVGFVLRKQSEAGEGDKKTVTLRMKASSFFIAALVDPVDFKFSSSGDRLLELNGRVAPKQKKDGKFVDLDAEMVYFYP